MCGGSAHAQHTTVTLLSLFQPNATNIGILNTNFTAPSVRGQLHGHRAQRGDVRADGLREPVVAGRRHALARVQVRELRRDRDDQALLHPRCDEAAVPASLGAVFTRTVTNQIHQASTFHKMPLHPMVFADFLQKI